MMVFRVLWGELGGKIGGNASLTEEGIDAPENDLRIYWTDFY